MDEDLDDFRELEDVLDDDLDDDDLDDDLAEVDDGDADFDDPFEDDDFCLDFEDLASADDSVFGDDLEDLRFDCCCCPSSTGVSDDDLRITVSSSIIPGVDDTLWMLCGDTCPASVPLVVWELPTKVTSIGELCSTACRCHTEITPSWPSAQKDVVCASPPSFPKFEFEFELEIK